VLSDECEQSLLEKLGCPLSRAEVAPLGKSGGADKLEIGSGEEVAFLIEVIVN
jgi:hypothetical protein